jgi:transforming growth factor-beta-induced protein
MVSGKTIAVSASVLALASGIAFGQCKSSCSDESKSAHKVDAKMTSAAYHAENKDIIQVAEGAGSFNTLVAAIKAAGLAEALKGKGPFTVFAPTDEAFAKLPMGTVETLLKPENKARLASILKYHVLSGNITAKDVKTGSAATLDGQRIDLVANAGKVTVDNATVTKTDIAASNGVIHVIDTVILPSDKNVVQTAVAAGKFTTLAKLLEAADLVSALEGDGPFTVFAPTDEAFAKLPKETVDSLLKPEGREKLAAILKYHVVSGRVFSDAAVKAGTAKTLNGASVTIKATAGTVMIDAAKVVGADIDATNGVIHVIDTVILPK